MRGADSPTSNPSPLNAAASTPPEGRARAAARRRASAGSRAYCRKSPAPGMPARRAVHTVRKDSGGASRVELARGEDRASRPRFRILKPRRAPPSLLFKNAPAAGAAMAIRVSASPSEQTPLGNAITGRTSSCFLESQPRGMWRCTHPYPSVALRTHVPVPRRELPSLARRWPVAPRRCIQSPTWYAETGLGTAVQRCVNSVSVFVSDGGSTASRRPAEKSRGAQRESRPHSAPS